MDARRRKNKNQKLMGVTEADIGLTATAVKGKAKIGSLSDLGIAKTNITKLEKAVSSANTEQIKAVRNDIKQMIMDKKLCPEGKIPYIMTSQRKSAGAKERKSKSGKILKPASAPKVIYDVGDVFCRVKPKRERCPVEARAMARKMSNDIDPTKGYLYKCSTFLVRPKGFRGRNPVLRQKAILAEAKSILENPSNALRVVKNKNGQIIKQEKGEVKKVGVLTDRRGNAKYVGTKGIYMYKIKKLDQETVKRIEENFLNSPIVRAIRKAGVPNMHTKFAEQKNLKGSDYNKARFNYEQLKQDPTASADAKKDAKQAVLDARAKIYREAIAEALVFAQSKGLSDAKGEIIKAGSKFTIKASSPISDLVKTTKMVDLSSTISKWESAEHGKKLKLKKLSDMAK